LLVQASASDNALEKALSVEGGTLGFSQGQLRLPTLASGFPSAIDELCAPEEAG